MWISLVIVFMAVAIICYVKTYQRRKYPPSPIIWWPIIGHRLLTKNLSKKLGSLQAALWHLAKEYKTDVLGLKITGNYTVVVFGEKLNRKVFLGKEFQARPRNYFNTLRSMGTDKGITMTDGQLWHVQRSFLMKQLSELGLGGDRMDSLIEDEFKNLISDIGDGGKKVAISSNLNQRTINILWHLVAGKPISGDNRMPRLLDLMNQRSRAFDIAGGYLAHMPWLRFIAPEASGFKLVNQINQQLHSVVSETINDHKRTYNKNVTRDFIDAFLHEMYKKEDNTTFTDDQLMMMCLDLFIAGLQTSTHTLEFSILRMVNHQDVQAKIQAELDKILLPNQIPSFSDRAKLPYTNAAMTEILRASGVIPIIGPRRVLCDTELDGYFIPKGTTILMHMNSVMKNPETWTKPDDFIPERFLEDTDSEKQQFYPFSSGKRRCPGEVMARSFIFVFFCGLLHFYKLEPVEGEEMPSLEPVPGITNTPKPYSIRLTRRHQVPQKS